jgi:hypothetical protein
LCGVPAAARIIEQLRASGYAGLEAIADDAS